MSRNFELLQHAAKEDWLTPVGTPARLSESAPSPAFTREFANEEITKLVQRLFLQGSQACALRVVSFSGMAHDDRSSWICANAGKYLASQADASVCVVDANIRSPQLHTHFGADNRVGLTDAMAAGVPSRNLAMLVAKKNLWLMPAGQANATPYTHAERWRELFAELRAEFNYVLVSAPALTHETEAIMTGHLADGVVLIVEANQTRRDAVRRAKEHLENAQVHLLGAVLDQRTFPIPEGLYRRL
jgi:Mrp family chromosome partitioning ATPase